MRVVSIVGARPQFVKLAPVAKAFAAEGIDHKIIHTGQHYDVNMSDSFFIELGIPNPDLHLGVGGGSHGLMTGRMLEQLDPVLEEMAPDWVLVYGDTNSTIAGTLSAVKMHLPVAHLEAGLRSFNRRMPEEHNRVLTDHAADLCLAPTEVAMGHLADEGLAARSVLVGDVMTDVCLQVLPRLALTDDQPAGSPLLPMQCDDRDALVNPVTLGGDDEVIVVAGPDQRPRFLVEDPVVVAVMHRRQGHHPAEARGIGHQSLLPASSSTLATLAAALPSP